MRIYFDYYQGTYHNLKLAKSFLYSKEIEFRFNHRQENVFRVLTNIVAKTVPNL
jgi:hypothetical protein